MMMMMWLYDSLALIASLLARLYFWFYEEDWRASHPVAEHTLAEHNGLRIKIIPSLATNLCYAISHVKTPDEVIVFDVVEPDFQERFLPNAKVVAQFATHWHPDHCRSLFSDGIALSALDSRRAWHTSTVFSPVDEHAIVLANVSILPVLTPCHTKGHMCFYVRAAVGDAASAGAGVILTGDTVFSGGGAGQYFEGDAAQFLSSLQKLKRIVPDDALLLPGHEYSKANARWAQLEPRVVARIENCRAEKRPYVCTWGEERQCSPFLRASTAQQLKQLREDKNAFKDTVSVDRKSH